MASAGSSRRHVGFGGHQFAEYALAAAVAVVGLHLNGRSELVLAVAGGVLALSAITSNGPLAAWRVVPRRVHLYFDLLVAACFALSPLLYLPSLPLIPIVIGEAVAVVLVRMSLTTEIVARPRPERGAKPTGAGTAGSITGAALPGNSRPDGPPSDTGDVISIAAGTAGRILGSAVAKARDSGAPLAAARGLGRVTGHARRLGRATAAGKAGPPTSQSGGAPPRSSEPAG
ncbi:MAG: hypothetical protein ABSD85_12610 [Acidimicrobiales bacterium]|jgi:hypothetical protein